MAGGDGRDPAALGSALYHNININDDRAKALEESKAFLDAYYTATFTPRFVEQWTVAGTPRQCVADLQAYCYVVAGIVGELLTELFLLGRPELAAVAPVLRQGSRPFGEGLQLVNILKDSAADATAGRRYLPEGVARGEVTDLARRDLAAAGEYVLALQRAGAERGLVAFNALPIHLADATLDRLATAGPGAKLTRPEVFAIVQRLHRTLDRGEPAVAVPGTPLPAASV